MPGILEEINDRLKHLEAAIGETRAPAPASDSIWADGALTLTQAQEFAGIGRDELWALMRSGELPYATPTRSRVVPRRWLVQYLAELAEKSKVPA